MVAASEAMTPTGNTEKNMKTTAQRINELGLKAVASANGYIRWVDATGNALFSVGSEQEVFDVMSILNNDCRVCYDDATAWQRIALAIQHVCGHARKSPTQLHLAKGVKIAQVYSADRSPVKLMVTSATAKTISKLASEGWFDSSLVPPVELAVGPKVNVWAAID
jgi:hypothetical protein